ncbi:MAG: squalene--hopene cyclase [Planctomycetota bacterium]
MALSTLLVVLALGTAAACAAMAFTRWGRKRPLHRYGALSIAAHLLLLAGMASVRMGGPPQSGSEDAPPVRVQIVMRTTAPAEPDAEPEVEPPAEAVEEPAAEPQAEEPASPEAVAVEAKPLPDEVVAVVSPQEASPVPAADPVPIDADDARDKPTAEQVAVSNDEPTQSQSMPTPPRQEAFEPPVPVERTPEPAPVAESTTPPVPAVPAVSPFAPSTYAQRGAVQQRRLAADQGGTQETLDAVASAVDWFARAQRPDGGWDAARWGAGRQTDPQVPMRSHAGLKAETGLTGLALLAMGGAGHTHLAGPYRDHVRAGLQYLLDRQARDGDLAGEASLNSRTYCHSMATFALAEAMAVSGDERLRPAVEAAVGFLARSQNRTGGGWRYKPGDRGDMSQMGWAVMALRSAELAGVTVGPDVWQGCERFVASVRRGQHGGLAAYQPQGRVSRTMTAEAMYCRQILGIEARRGAAGQEAVASLIGKLPGQRSRSGRDKANLYYWYYATLALHHHRSHGETADRAWREWNDAMQRALLPKQVAHGPNQGSWGADTVWGGYGGRVYATALATMCLEVYYRYDPETIGRDPWIAARGGTLTR